MTEIQKHALNNYYHNFVAQSEQVHELIYNPVVLGKTFEQAIADLDHSRLDKILQVRKDLLMLEESIEELKAGFIVKQKALLDQREEQLQKRKIELVSKLSAVDWSTVALGHLELAWSAANAKR